MRRIASASALLAVIALGGCAGSDGGNPKTFEASEVPVTFQYPSSWETSTSPTIASEAGNDPAFKQAVALDNDNLILVEIFDLNVEITKRNLGRAKPELDNIIAEVAPGAVSGKRVAYAGLPGFEYTIDLTEPPDGQSRVVFLFDGRTEIELNCQSTPDERNEVNEACDQALSTLRKA